MCDLHAGYAGESRDERSEERVRGEEKTGEESQRSGRDGERGRDGVSTTEDTGE